MGKSWIQWYVRTMMVLSTPLPKLNGPGFLAKLCGKCDKKNQNKINRTVKQDHLSLF